MKNLILTLLNKTSGTETPDNYTETSIKITELGKIILGIALGVVITFCIIYIVKGLKKQSKDNDDHNNDTKN